MSAALKLPTSARIAALKQAATPTTTPTPQRSEADAERACLAALDAEMSRLGLKPNEHDTRRLVGHCATCGVKFTDGAVVHLCRAGGGGS